MARPRNYERETVDTIVVTGGAGFIGANFVRHALRHTDARIVVLDKLTYAGNVCTLDDLKDEPRFAFVRGDIGDQQVMDALFCERRPAALINFAAETHVDRSVDNPRPFVETNILGTFVLLESVRAYVRTLNAIQLREFRFLHVSTDEVYGTLGETGYFLETTPYAPNSPYSASKASADHLVRAYQQTYGLPALITNCSNNYGPYQFPEKLIPLMTLNAAEGKPLPIYGEGGNIRDWLYVEDHCAGILLALRNGRVGEKYNIGGGNERTNLQVVDEICTALEEMLPPSQNKALRALGVKHYSELKSFVPDRPAHDWRYAIDSSKIQTELGWQAEHDFGGAIRDTVAWYLKNRAWCESVQAGKYGRERLGITQAGSD
jgi:dTDP-glucose 4,6-dehydratase